ncbi:PPM-type phosphatase domain-containing protein [Favolaschia claudopus]|uniref:PPM-type phosphatase domain-containing protein n=1 Tax=Favolaschia claudopus TaxID=2862362 RepID=A0AAW0C9C0_9AGAR
MIFRSAYLFARSRTRWPALAASRPLKVSSVILGISASMYLASLSLNKVHADSDSSPPSSEPPPDNESHSPPPLEAGFTADKTEWPLAIRYLGDALPDGLPRIYNLTRFDVRIRTMSRKPRVLINVLEGELLNRVNIADIVAENLWFNLEALFRWYQVDHTNPQPVEFMHEPHPPPEAIQTVLKTAVNFTDEYILNYFLGRAFSSLSKRNAADPMRGSTSACLVSALYEDDVRLLHVASLGNMRALLGRPREADENGTVKYDVHILSVDHSPSNPSEKSRVESLHEGENVIENDTLFGRPYTRAIGDGKLKWSPDVQSRLHKDYLGAAPDPRVKTPPYISAEPDVTSIKIRPGDFLVLSSSWLHECLTDQEVVGLVGAWLDKNEDTFLDAQNNLPQVVPKTPPAAILPEDLPVDMDEKEDKTVMYRRWNVSKRFVNVDNVPSAHLANNAMGGADLELRNALMEMPPAHSEGNTKSLGVAVLIFR